MNSLIRKMICVAGALVLVTSAYAQLSLGKSAYQEMIEESLKPALFVTKSSYRISNKETKNLYGYKGKDEFGVQYSLGLCVDGALVLPSPAVRPWAYDNNFTKYAEEYNPVMYKTQMAWLNEPSTFVDYEQNIENPDSEKSIFVLNCDIPSDRQMSTDDTTGKKNGWLVWIVGDVDSNNWEMLLYSKEVCPESQSKPVALKKPITDKKVLGAIFVVPSFPIAGQIWLNAVGIADFKDGNWKLYFPFINDSQPQETSTNNDSSAINDTKSSLGDLTPSNGESMD